MKHKKHWNSFTTPFFLRLDDVIAKLHRDGVVHVDREACTLLLKQDLACPFCHTSVRQLPKMKAHVAQCPLRLESI